MQNKKLPYRTTNTRSWRTPLLYILCFVIALAVLAGILYVTKHFPFLHRTPTVVPAISGNAYTKGEPKTTIPPPAPSPAPTPSPAAGSDKNQSSPPGATTTLVAPTGTFVSNHHPHLSDNPSGSAFLASTCTTTQGATCKITFTKDGITKSLPSETTDAGGSAYWNNWKLQDYGLTEGSWSIHAIATLNGQTQTAADAMNLEVAQ